MAEPKKEDAEKSFGEKPLGSSVQPCEAQLPAPESTSASERKDLIGPMARADLETIPGGKGLLDKHDDPATPDDKALSLRQEAAVALHKHRNRENDPNDEVVAIGREVGPEGKRETEIDVETRTEQIDVKGGDFTGRSSLSKKQNEKLAAKARVAKREGKTPIYQVEPGKMDDDLKQKIEKRGVVVRQERIPTEEIEK